MQAVREKLHDMNAMRKAKAEARAEEQTEKEMANTRMEVAREVRLAKEADAAADLHVARARQKIEREEAKHAANHPNAIAIVDPPELDRCLLAAEKTSPANKP